MNNNKNSSNMTVEEFMEEVIQEAVQELQADPQELEDKCKRAGIRLNPSAFPSFCEEDSSDIVLKE